jgi:fatty-acyl-CoA synthase
MSAATLHKAFAAAAAAAPESPLNFPGSGEYLTLHKLDSAATAAARGLVAAGVAPGDRIGVLSRNNADFLVGILGVAAAGAAACPLPLPTSVRDLGGYAARLVAIMSAAGIHRVVVGARTDATARRISGVLPDLEFLPAATLTGSADVPLPPVTPEDLAVVQFTSGSTSVPKGVQLTHANVLHGCTAIIGGVGMGPGDHAANWLPLFHDMGLFGTLSALLTPIPMTVWTPSAFIKDPAAWLRDFSARRCTVVASPNFGYEALVDAVAPTGVLDLDLSCWRVAFNGAEPVLPGAVERFVAHFAPAGFAPEAMYPVYGMAEATLAVTFPPAGRPTVTTWVDRDRLAAGEVVEVPRNAARARGFVALGHPVRAMELRVVDEAGGVLPADRVGEIEIRGAAVTRSYLGAGTAEEPTARGGWLPTGDLGFLHDGDLYVTGRRKEMIIIRGENYYPEDAEAAVRDTPGLHRRRCVAVADTTADGAEVITVLGETAVQDPDEAARLAAEIHAAVSRALDLDRARVRVHLVDPDALPRTSSGKFRRSAARELAHEPTQKVPDGTRRSRAQL